MHNSTDYQLSAAVNEGILEIAIKGEITENAVENLKDDVLTVLKSTRPRNVMIDVRNIKGRFGPIEAYFRVRSYPPDRPMVNTAIVDLQENADYQTFHETTGRNAGLSMKWFKEINDARNWLKSR